MKKLPSILDSAMLTKLVQLYGEQWPLEALKLVDGYYNCPKDSDGKRLGPLVGYAGTYIDSSGAEKAYVGDLYANFAKAEQQPMLLDKIASELSTRIIQFLQKEEYAYIERAMETAKFYIAAPEKGGFAIGMLLARHLRWKLAYVEKEIIALKTTTEREQSKLAFKRHAIEPGSLVMICEDVLNNFSTTKKTVALIESWNSKVVGIAGILNRSINVEDSWGENNIPVLSLLRMPAAEYQQDDPRVAADIQAGNIVLKPKDEWEKLPEEGKG